MYTFNQLYYFTKIMLRSLFDPDNYCFATTTDRRSPTFYFAYGGIAALNTARICGRIRTCHKNGPLVEMSATSRKHLFFQSIEGRDSAYATLKNGLDETDLNSFLSRHHSVPLERYAHIEIMMKASEGKPYSRLHRSQGLVSLVPRLTTWSQVENLLNRIFLERAPIRLDKDALPVPCGLPAGLPHQPIPNLSNFITTL